MHVESKVLTPNQNNKLLNLFLLYISVCLPLRFPSSITIFMGLSFMGASSEALANRLQKFTLIFEGSMKCKCNSQRLFQIQSRKQDQFPQQSELLYIPCAYLKHSSRGKDRGFQSHVYSNDFRRYDQNEYADVPAPEPLQQCKLISWCTYPFGHINGNLRNFVFCAMQ